MPPLTVPLLPLAVPALQPQSPQATRERSSPNGENRLRPAKFWFMEVFVKRVDSNGTFSLLSTYFVEE
jgi:hypothetical protein